MLTAFSALCLILDALILASIFHEFLQKYQYTLEQTAAANGRFILPKAVPVDSSSPKKQDEHSCHIPKTPADITSRSATGCCVGTGSAWDNCAHTESETHLPIAQIPLAPTHSSIPVQSQGLTPMSVHQLQTPDTEMLNSSSSVVAPCSIQTNTFVTNLANSILANIFGTIQSTAGAELSTLQQAQDPSPSYSKPSSTPLTEIQNMPEKTAMIPISSVQPKEGFVNVDELLVKPGSRIKAGMEYLPPSSAASYTFGSLVNQKPITTPHESSGQNCSIPTTAENAMATVNPNAFLNSQQFDKSVASAVSSSFDKENLLLLKTGNRYEKSPKRQRMN